MEFDRRHEGQIHNVDFVDFIKKFEPEWCDVILTGPSGANSKKEEIAFKWIQSMYRCLKFGGIALFVHRPWFPEKWVGWL